MATPPPRESSRRSHPRSRPKTNTADKLDSSQNPRRKFKRRATDSLSDSREFWSEDDDSRSSMSEELELDAIGSDGDDVDEETGLTGKERQKHLQNKRRQHALDARIAGGNGLSLDERQAADKSVIHRLVVNAMLIAAWYVFSLSISLYNKWMFSDDHLNFHFPMFTTSLHMIVQFLLASTVLLIFPKLRPASPSLNRNSSNSNDPSRTQTKPLVTPLFYLTRLVPTGISTSLDIGLGNTSLRYITLTFYTMCKSSVLIFVLTFAFLFRLEQPSIKLILIILTMTLGVLLMVYGETAFHLLGFLLAMSASFFSGFRWGLTQILLLRHPATSNPFATLFFLAPIMFATLFIISLFAESPSAIVSGLHILVSEQGLAKALVLLIIPGSLAFCMIAAEFTLLQRTSVVTLSICGIFKEVVTISAAGIIFHDELSAVNVSGLLVTVACIAYYNWFKVSKMREEERKKFEKRLDDDAAAAAAGSELHRSGVHGRRNETTRPRSRSDREERYTEETEVEDEPDGLMNGALASGGSTSKKADDDLVAGEEEGGRARGGGENSTSQRDR